MYLAAGSYWTSTKIIKVVHDVPMQMEPWFG